MMEVRLIFKFDFNTKLGILIFLRNVLNLL